MGRSRRLFSCMRLLVHFICCISLVSSETRCIASERRALIRLKNGFVDDYGLLSSWSSDRSSQDCCLWQGVGCSNITGHVKILDLHGSWPDDLDGSIGLSGDINPALLDLPQLNYLDLSFGSFTRIPRFIGSMRELRYLNLSHVDFGISKVPPQLGNLSHLQILDLSGSPIILKNTEWFFKLSALEHVSLSYVDVTESSNLLKNLLTRLPSLFEMHLDGCYVYNVSAIGLLPVTNFSRVLSILDISYNFLPASKIYPWLFNFTDSLTDIDLSYNWLNGTIPEAFGKFTSLHKLDLTASGLKRGMPASFGNWSSLQSLHLERNSLKEDLPRFFNRLSPAEKSLQVLELSNNEFFGSLPDFTKFTALEELYLGNNEMNGSFPERFEYKSKLVILDLTNNQIAGLLPDLSALSSLQKLVFERNRLGGTLGEKIMPLFALQILGASANLLNGTITETHLSNLSRLFYLDLSYNSHLVLDIDPNWSTSISLDVMLLSSCKLGPSFPTWLQTQKNFSILDISSSQINDSVPDWFWGQLTPNLVYLNMSCNRFHGIVPDLMYGNEPFIDLRSNNFFGHVPLFPSNTQVLVLRDNMFSGSVSLCYFTSIRRIDLSNNKLSGKLPDCWMNLTSLYYLNLDSNQFTGKIPISMGSLSVLLMLSISNNSLNGNLPTSLKKCRKLILLDVGENSLAGRIPTWIGKSLPELRVLSLASNGFHGTMPTSLCNLSNMQILDLSVNNITGTIPGCLSKFKGMTDITTNEPRLIQYRFALERTRDKDVNYDTFEAVLQWKGNKYHYSNTLGLVTIIDLSSNILKGEIPREITNLSALVALNLSRNNLTMQIPQDIGRLRRLDFLDLSRNHLSGGIPKSISQLTSLGMLDLSYNNLSGRIPTSTQLQSFGASSYIANQALCGLPLRNTCPGDFVPENPRTTVDAEDIGDEDKLTTRGFFISLMIGLAFGFCGFCGTLVLSNSQRQAYFNFLEHITNWIYVVVAVNYNRLHRRS